MIRIASALKGLVLSARFRALALLALALRALFVANHVAVARAEILHWHLTRLEIDARIASMIHRQHEPERLQDADPTGHLVDEIALVGGAICLALTLFAADWAVLSHPDSLRAIAVAVGGN